VNLSANTVSAPSCDMTVATDPPTDPTTATDPPTDPTTATDPPTDPTTATDPPTDPTTATDTSTATGPATAIATSSAGPSGATNSSNGGADVAGVQAGQSGGPGAESISLASTGVSPMLRSLLAAGALLPVLGAGLLIAARRSRLRGAAAAPGTASIPDAPMGDRRRWRPRPADPAKVHVERRWRAR
jgi:hypothetical protein